MSPRGHHAGTSRASRGFDGVLAALGLALLAAAFVWLVLLIREGAAVPVPPHPSNIETTLAAVTESEAMLEDDAFGVALPGRALRRVVQMLQWREVASVALALDDEIVVDQEQYQLLWSERLIDSSAFAQVQGHVNPPAPPYRSRSLGAGASGWTDADADAWRTVPPAQVVLPENLAAVFRAEGAWLTTTAQGALPEPGDLRVRFEVLPEAAPVAQSTPVAASADATPVDPLDEALRWIARAAAFVMAMLGAGLALRGFSRLSPPQGRLGHLRSGALLAISAWIAVGAALVAAGIARLV